MTPGTVLAASVVYQPSLQWWRNAEQFTRRWEIERVGVMHDRDGTVATTNLGWLLNYKVRSIRLDVVDGDECQ